MYNGTLVGAHYPPPHYLLCYHVVMQVPPHTRGGTMITIITHLPTSLILELLVGSPLGCQGLVPTKHLEEYFDIFDSDFDNKCQKH